MGHPLYGICYLHIFAVSISDVKGANEADFWYTKGGKQCSRFMIISQGKIMAMSVIFHGRITIKDLFCSSCSHNVK